jgi:(1->4)-alpha-D-glucan 1-alpha-D-glucosylmutase
VNSRPQRRTDHTPQRTVLSLLPADADRASPENNRSWKGYLLNDKGMPTARIPSSTYRLQFNRSFTFRDATRIIGYLHDLGVTDIYASPYFKAKAGSMHGYDIVDHNALNPEIGAEEDCRAMVAELKRHGMGQVLDIVPNHMCIESPENAWWMDVLENGPSSPYARFFDIDWTPVKKELKDKVLIPVLGSQYGDVLENQEIQVVFDQGAFTVRYYEHAFPIRPQTYVQLLELRLEELRTALPEQHADLVELLSILTALRNLPSYLENDLEKINERYREKEVIKKRLGTLYGASPDIRSHVDTNVLLVNGTKGDAKSFDLLDELMNQQIYRLSYWRVATEEINYRRFFDINGLGAIRMEHAEVFAATHALVFRLVREGSVTGLRVDHPDGLYNPVEYFHRLQRGCFVQQSLADASTGNSGAEAADVERGLAQQYDETVLADAAYRPFYIVGEKILTKAERMPEDWPIFSTTGYVFLNSVNGVFVAGEHAKAFDSLYAKFIKVKINIQDVIYEKKKLVMQVGMASEVNTLGHILNDMSEKNRHTRDFTLNSLTAALIEVIALFPVYRTYTNTWQVTDRDRQVIELALSRAKRKNPAISESIFDFLGDVLLLRFSADSSDAGKAAWLDFTMRFQQITGPVMAKGMEDTAFYVYNRLSSLNEVGGMPERFGTPLETFHGQNIERMKSWPHALITTATHDMKRGEDTRQRINVLSEMPREWSDRIRAWSRLNKKHKAMIDGAEAPDRNEEYLLYQTLIGSWPVDPADPSGGEAFVQRIEDYMIKALREAKVNTSWINPNSRYETAVQDFVRKVLRPGHASRFLADFAPFQKTVSHYGMFNSLSQTLLKICSPGVPDFYQGTELWDFSLVDPDNRRTVDFARRLEIRSDLIRRRESMTGVALAWDLVLAKDDGAVKLHLIHEALRFRREHRRLFAEGEYRPLEAQGTHAVNLCAFARTYGNDTVLAVVPRFLARLIAGPGALPFGKAVWADTAITLSDREAGLRFQNVFTGEVLSSNQEGDRPVLYLADVFASFPVALLHRLSGGGA